MVFKPTDRFLRHHCRHPLAFISEEWQHKKNGEKTSSFDDVTVFLLAIFSINLLLLFLMLALWYCSPQTVFCTAIAALHSCSFQKSDSTKRTARKHQVLMMLQFFFSPFFQLTCCFYFLRAICGIEAHRPFFAPPLPPPTCVHSSRAAAQKER